MSSETQEKRPEWLVPGYPELAGEVGQAAVNGQMLYYPKVARSKKDEGISKQHMGLVSFVLLKEPQKLKNGKPLYGFFKLRGNWADLEQAESKAARIVREQDSKYKIRVVDVGEWLPLTDDDGLAQKNVNINLDATDEERKREIAMREEEANRAAKMRELREREEEVRNGGDYNDDTKSLNHYTMKMVVWLRIQENIEQLRTQISSLEGKLEGVRDTLRNLDDEFPEYQRSWIDNYNIERRKAGIPDHVPTQREIDRYAATARKTSGDGEVPVASASTE